MTAPVWPTTIPQRPDNGGWTETPQRNVAEFQPEVGPPKLRRRNTANGGLAQAMFTLSDTELADFDLFYEKTLVDGTLPFTWEHPISGIVYNWIFSAEPGRNAVRFDQHRVSVDLRRLP